MSQRVLENFLNVSAPKHLTKTNSATAHATMAFASGMTGNNQKESFPHETQSSSTSSIPDKLTATSTSSMKTTTGTATAGTTSEAKPNVRIGSTVTEMSKIA